MRMLWLWDDDVDCDDVGDGDDDDDDDDDGDDSGSCCDDVVGYRLSLSPRSTDLQCQECQCQDRVVCSPASPETAPAGRVQDKPTEARMIPSERTNSHTLETSPSSFYANTRLSPAGDGN